MDGTVVNLQSPFVTESLQTLDTLNTTLAVACTRCACPKQKRYVMSSGTYVFGFGIGELGWSGLCK